MQYTLHTEKPYHIRPLTEDELLSIYTSVSPRHFPAEELRPTENIRLLLSKKGYEGLGLFQSEQPNQKNGESSPALLGYALFVHIPGADVVLLDFYAILEEYRSLGLGSFFLQGIRSYYAAAKEIAGLLLETEDPGFSQNEAQLLERRRRNAFYYKNGAYLSGVKCTLFGVPFRILYLPIASPAECPDAKIPAEAQVLREKLDAVYHFMLTDELYSRNVIWR